MAYMNKEKKAIIAPAVKAVLKKYGMKGTLRVDNYSTLALTIVGGKLDLIAEANNHNKRYAERHGTTPYPVEDSFNVNHYWAVENTEEPTIKKFYEELIDAMNGVGTEEENFDKSDIMTDYFHVGYYIDIRVGRWNKPYALTA